MEIDKVIILDRKDKEQRPPTIDQFNQICRVCLEKLPTNGSNVKTIHDEENQLNIKSLIEAYSYLKISDEALLPQHVCLQCVAFLIDMHTFRSRCRVNEDLLNKIKTNYRGDRPTHPVVRNDTNFDNYEEERMQELITKINDQRLGIFKCKDCPAVFVHQSDLNKHRMETKHSKTKATPCVYCNKMFNSHRINLHMRTHTKEKPFSCSICGTCFSLKQNYSRHMKRHVNEKTKICEICGKGYSRTETLLYHQRTMHPKEPPEGSENSTPVSYRCQVCSKHFKTPEQLKLHVRYHAHSFLCPECGKTFALKANLTAHMRVHTGERPFSCSECPRTFGQISSFRTHMAVHSGERVHKCTYCSRQFYAKSKLVAHLRIHTGETPYHCLPCRRSYCTSNALNKHNKLHHKETNAKSESHIKVELGNNDEELQDSEEELQDDEEEEEASDQSIEYITQQIPIEESDIVEEDIYYTIEADEIERLNAENEANTKVDDA